MLHFFLLSYAFIHAGLLVWTLSAKSTQGTHRQSWRIAFLCALLFGMCYDNMITGLGNLYFDHDWYPAANVPRFILHAMILPFLPLFAFSLLRATTVGSVRQRLLPAALTLFTGAAVMFGFYHEVVLLELGDKSALGVHKLGNLSSAPPWATILTNLVFLPLAWVYWRATGWPWMLLGGGFIFIVNGASATQPWGFLAGNFAEVVFIVSLILTERHQQFYSQQHVPQETSTA